MPVPIWLQGVWDTVGALGVPFGHVPVISRSNYGFLETDLRINQTHAFHAVAIDEHREAFAPTLWTKSVRANTETYPNRTLAQVEQRWFVGAHADVGGGYDNGLLAQIPLIWMMKKAEIHGLTFKGPVELEGEETGADIHDSFGAMAGGAYKAVKMWQRYYRNVGAPAVVVGDTTSKSINETIDASVFERYRADPSYRPPNLTHWAREHRVATESLTDSVRADDLAPVA
jgi:hypothetical protein